MNAIEFRKAIEDDGKLKAAKRIEDSVECIEQADAVILAYVHNLLHAGKKGAAGVVLWGEALFNPRPYAVRMVWDAINKKHKVLVQGGGAVSKSYTGMAWNILNWWQDPEYTTVKLISTTGGHAKSNTFSTIKMFYEKAIVQMPGHLTAETLSFKEGDQRGAIAIVRIKEGEEGSGVLQGFHPLPRPKPHPIFGPTSRVVAVLDEAEEIPLGVWGGVDNMLTSIDDTGCVKIMAFYNPKDPSAKTAQLAEPPGGWAMVDIEAGYKGKDTWTSRDSWEVVRLDPKKTENVQKRKVIYPGFQTYEGYKTLEQKNGGNSLAYYTFGRGVYPPDGTVCTVVTQRILNGMRGEMIFVAGTVKAAGADTAIDGRDDCVYVVGRTGRATGMRLPNGEIIRFPEERQVAQIDQIFELPKGSNKIVANAMKSTSMKLQVQPGWFMLDRTGNGAPVHDLLTEEDIWSHEVRGIDFAKAATTMKILEQDKETPDELYEGIHTEVWFAFARWGEFGYLAISPNVRSDELDRQLIGRRYILGAGKKLRVEKKEDYKKRIGRSPDHADAATIFLHCVRENGGLVASMTGRAPREEYDGPEVGHGIVDTVEWMNDVGV